MPVRIRLTLMFLTGLAAQPLVAAELAWSTGGPYGGLLNCLVVETANPSRLYACTQAGGLFRSDDAGATWQPKTDGLGFALSAIDLVVDPQDANRVYLAYEAPERQGVLRSSDRGETWIEASFGLPGSGFLLQDLEIDPADPARLWALFYDEPLYTSANGGLTWSPLAERSNLSGRLLAMPGNPTRLFLGSGNGLRRSTDAGVTWQSLPTGIGAEVDALTGDPTSPQTLYVAQGEFISRSTDGGASWVNVDTGYPSQGGLFRALRVDAANPSTIYAAGQQGLERSLDGGATWAPFEGTGLPSSALSWLAGPTGGGAVLYVAGPFNQGLFRTTDGGVSWQSANEGLAATRVLAVATDPTSSAVAYAAVASVGVFKTVDGGASWALAGGSPRPVRPTALAVGGGVVWAGDLDGRIWKSLDQGLSWLDLGVVTSSSVNVLVIDPTNPLVVYALTANAYKTTDGGSNWMPISSGLLGSAVLDAVLDPANPLTLYAATSTNAVFKSLDGAGSWASARSGLTPNRIGDVDLSASAPTNLFALADTFGASSVWESLDGAGGWVERLLPFPGWQLKGLAAAPEVASTVHLAASEVDTFLGTEGRAQVFTLRTAGGSCSTLAPGLPPLEPHRLVEAGTHLYLATLGRGVWTVSGVDSIVFGDGFESGTTAAWSAVVP